MHRLVKWRRQRFEERGLEALFSFVVLYRSGQFFPRKQLRQETVERFHDDGQSFAHVLDGFRDLFTFVLALAFSIRFESLLGAAQQSA